jgi:tetratricopeptide (TPR) repeat protein
VRESLKSIREGGTPSELGAVSFAEGARKRAEAEVKAAEQASARKPAEPLPPPPPAQESAEESAEDTEDEGDIVRDALGRLQAKVHEEIGESDLDTRYNLGIAYKEMGLFDEAVKEFRLAMKKPELVVGACSMLADTLTEKGDAEGAFAVLDEVLGGAAVTELQRRDLQYQKAVLLSRAGQETEAGLLFVSLAETFPGYRDVDVRAKRYRS